VKWFKPTNLHKSPGSQCPATSVAVSNVSGGVNINSGETRVGGDVVGRDRLDQSTHGDTYHIHIGHADNLGLGVGAGAWLARSAVPLRLNAPRCIPTRSGTRELALIEERQSGVCAGRRGALATHQRETAATERMPSWKRSEHGIGRRQHA